MNDVKPWDNNIISRYPVPSSFYSSFFSNLFQIIRNSPCIIYQHMYTKFIFKIKVYFHMGFWGLCIWWAVSVYSRPKSVKRITFTYLLPIHTLIHTLLALKACPFAFVTFLGRLKSHQRQMLTHGPSSPSQTMEAVASASSKLAFLNCSLSYKSQDGQKLELEAPSGIRSHLFCPCSSSPLPDLLLPGLGQSP